MSETIDEGMYLFKKSKIAIIRNIIFVQAKCSSILYKMFKSL